MLAKGTKREIRVNLLLLKGSKNKTVFVMPDLHYGPFAGVGGGLLPESRQHIVRIEVNDTESPAAKVKDCGTRVSASKIMSLQHVA